MLRAGLVWLFLALFAPAYAYPADERALMQSLGRAYGGLFTGTPPAEVRPQCEAMRTSLTPSSPKYFAGYVEECFALTAGPLGPQKKPETCPYYQRAIAIWTANPPPKDDEESQIKRAGKFKSWKDALARECPALAPPKPVRTPPAAIPRGVVETQENLLYVLPEGWSVKSFDDTAGAALLENKALFYFLRVERTSRPADADLVNVEQLANGRTLRWKHEPYFKGLSAYMLLAYAELGGANLSLFVTALGKETPAGVDKEKGLAAVRDIVASAKILGPRKCIGDCPPGTVRAP